MFDGDDDDDDPWVSTCYEERSKKFCNSTIKNNGIVTNYTLFFNIVTAEFNAFATFFWQTVNIDLLSVPPATP